MAIISQSTYIEQVTPKFQLSSCCTLFILNHAAHSLPIIMQKIRILCLHGRGDNADIFRAQTALIRRILPSSYEFIFIDGEGFCDPLPNVGAMYPGPYRCWYSTPNTTDVAKAHEVIKKAIEKLGQFDVVMGFSQVSR
jgi:hypothetical protein